jgi:DNA-directed RNA polymerase beta' subunit
VQGSLGLSANSLVDITPLEAFQLIEEYFSRIKSLYYAPPTDLFETMYFYYLNPRELLAVKRFHRNGLVVLLETVFLKYKQAIVHPGEMVGVVAGQSIGEPTTQMTLNSFTYETEILVRNSAGEIKCVQIGDFVKWGIDTTKKMDYMKEKDTTYAELSEFYEVPSATEDGNTIWCRIEAVTKHPVINEDGTNTMVKVTTRGNREIIATKAKSFLQFIDGKIQGVNGSDLKVGDYLPVSKKALDFAEQTKLDLRSILPPTEYIYGSEMEKARSVMNEHHWWLHHSGKTFTLPYRRSDSAYCALNGGDKKKKTINRIVYKPGCVYTMTNSFCGFDIPDVIPLDYEFGYLIGAYCAEGCMTKHQVSISNNDNDYLKPIESWCERYGITTKVYTHRDKIQEGWTSQDIRIYSTILCRILDKMCGRLSHNKFVSDKIMFSNRQCILGFLDAYISGDGCVEKNKDRIVSINVGSVSLKMLTQVQVMIKNIGAIGKIYKNTPQETNNRGSTNLKQGYLLRVANQQAQLLGSLLNLSIQSKRERVASLLEQNFQYEYCKSDLQIPHIIENKTVMEPRNNRCVDLEFDQIVSIEEVPNTTDYAYDLTVENTRNFDCMNGVACRDTFHHAGVASKSNVTRGVPRIEEILRLTSNPKHPSLTVFLKPMDEDNADKAKQFANMMEHTKLADLVKSVNIHFDPDDKNTNIAEDRELMEQYYAFTQMVETCNEDQTQTSATEQKSKWIVRMEMDTESLLDKNITMDDIHFAIRMSSFGTEYMDCVYSDFNSDKLVFRLRVNTNYAKDKKRRGPDPLDQTDEIYLMKKYQDDLLNSIVLRGVHGIDNVIPRKLQNMVNKQDGKYERRDTWILDTTGTNLLETLALDYIDNKRTFSNDIKEIFDVLGIEAARQVIHNELVEVMEFSGAYINYHHLSLLCDRMTCNKDMVSIFRTGLFSDDIGPIAKATFEVHTEVLLDAARFGDFDSMRGVSANVMCGQPGYYGTNAFQLVLDMEAMASIEANDTQNEEEDILETIIGMGKEKSEDSCSRKNVEFSNNVKSIPKTNPGICDDGYDIGF